MMTCCVSLLAVLWLDISADSDATALRLEPRWTEELPAEASVCYRLDCGYCDRTWTNDYQQSQSRFAVDLSQGGVPNLFKVRAEVSTTEGTTKYDGVNTIALTWVPLAEDAEHHRLPVIFEQPGPTVGTGISIDTLLKCNALTGDEVFWSLDPYGCPAYGWRVDSDGRFCELDRYRIQSSGWERREYEALETVLPTGWMLKPEGQGVEVKGYWLCGQYLDLAAAGSITFTLRSPKPNTWNQDGLMYFAVPYVEGLAPTNVYVQVEKTESMDYLLPSGESGTLTTSYHYRWEPLNSLPFVLDKDGACVKGFPFGTVYRMVITKNRWVVYQAEYPPMDVPALKQLPRICVSTAGPDYYDDGELVRDGECYAVIKAAVDTETIAFTEDGKLVDPNQRLIAILPVAKDGHLPKTVLEFDPAISKTELEGQYFICLLDTRIDAQSLASLDGESPTPVFVGSCSAAPQTSAGALPSFAVTAAANFDPCVSPQIGQARVGPSPADVRPRIESFQVLASNVLLTVEGMASDSEYFVVPAKTVDAFEAPLPDRPVGKVFNLRKQDGYRFFKIVGQPKTR